MLKHSAVHFYLSWAKERIDEMDATLASFEAKVSEVQADSRVKANQALADMRKKRDEFSDTLKKQADANEAAWIKEKASLQSDWNAFEAEAKKYIESFGKQIEQASQPNVAMGQQRTHGVQQTAPFNHLDDARRELCDAGFAVASSRVKLIHQSLGAFALICSIASLTEKLAALARGGKSLKLSSHFATNACAGTNMNIRCADQSP